jgi:hypothetical protein
MKRNGRESGIGDRESAPGGRYSRLPNVLRSSCSASEAGSTPRLPARRPLGGFDSSIPAYLDSVCRHLRAGPAEAEDIREELQAHLEELARFYASQGTAPAEALDRALAQFGEAAKIGDTLDLVHEGDAWWLRRLKGLLLGMALGALLSALLPVGGHLDFALSRFSLPGGFALPRAEMVLNAALAGGLIGVCSARGKGLLIGWSLGAVLWLAEFVASWLWRAGGGAAESANSMLNAALLAPLLGGAFGAAVGFVSSTALAAASRIRPSMQ